MFNIPPDELKVFVIVFDKMIVIDISRDSAAVIRQNLARKPASY